MPRKPSYTKKRLYIKNKIKKNDKVIRAVVNKAITQNNNRMLETKPPN